METIRKEYSSIRTSPLKIVDCNAASRIINAIVFECYVRHNGHKNWAIDARQWLVEEFEIKQSIKSLHSLVHNLRRGVKDPRAASCFAGKISSRQEKDGMYRELDGLVKYTHAIENDGPPSYIGLPANQLLHVINKYNGRVVACERDRDMYDLMTGIKRHFAPRSRAKIICTDIIKYLNNCEEYFTVFDIDLMCIASSDGLVEKLGNGIAKCIDKFAVVCVVTCCGRHISQRKYASIMPARLISSINQCGNFDVMYSDSDGYTDQVIPMRYEILIIKRLGPFNFFQALK